MDTQVLIWFAASALVVTKFLDCYSTWSRGAPEVELNPLLRRSMKWFGFSPVVWGVFLIVCALAVLFGSLAMSSQDEVDKILFVCVGFAVSFVQLVVARKNFTLRGRYHPPH